MCGMHLQAQLLSAMRTCHSAMRYMPQSCDSSRAAAPERMESKK